MTARGEQQKAQVTIFFILGIVLIAVFAFAIYARMALNEDKLKEQADAILSDFVQANNVNYYVESCLEQVTTEALIKIGETGGYLNLPNTIETLPYKAEGKSYNISYGLTPNEVCSAVREHAPMYPKEDTPLDQLRYFYENGPCRANRASGYLGAFTLRLLCSHQGANTQEHTIGNFDLPCEREAFAYDDDNIQQALQKNISGEMEKCVDFDFLEELTDNNITLQEGTNTTVIYGKDSITIRTSFPFTVRVSQTQTVRTSTDFSHTSPVRLRRMYDYLIELIKEENNDHFHNLTRDYENHENYRAAFEVDIIKDVCKNNIALNCRDVQLFDDLIRIKDNNVKIGEEPYLYQTAIKDRKPALDYINPSGHSQYNIIATENQTLIVKPQGYDPDDGPVTYRYAGWKEDYNELFNFSKCIDPDCTNWLEIVEREPEVTPKNWSNSALYQQTTQEALINLTRNDTGAHHFQIYVTDDTGKEDYQNISVLVYDLPEAVIQPDNGFDGVPNDYASVEDPYWLDARESTASIIGGETLGLYEWRGYEWKSSDWQQTFWFEFDTDAYPSLANYQQIPYAVDTWTHNFYNPGQSIVQAPLNTTNNIPAQGIPYQLQLTVGSRTGASRINSNPVTQEITLLQCMPANPPGASDSPYPYNRSQNTFEYNHVCCQGTYGPIGPSDPTLEITLAEVLGSETTCFTLTRYGTLESMQGNHLWGYAGQDVEGTPQISYSGFNPNPLTKNQENDVFRQEIRRVCDGERGNTCTGDYSETISIQGSGCNDFLGDEQDERCQGPRTYFDSQYAVAQESSYYGQCQNYHRQTYEVLFDKNNKDGDAPDGICDNTWRCSVDDGYGDYIPYIDTNIRPEPGNSPITSIGFGYACQGQCSGGGCTYAAKCYCEEQCGAVVTESSDHHRLDGNTCRYGFNSGNCNYQSNTPCPQTCIDTTDGLDLNQFTSGNCETRDHAEEQYCYYREPASCTDSGCRLTLDENELRENHCDTCTSSGRIAGEYCPPVGELDGICYYAASSCSGNTCNGENTPMNSVSVEDCETMAATMGFEEEGWTVNCTDSGVQCCHETYNCLPPSIV